MMRLYRRSRYLLVAVFVLAALNPVSLFGATPKYIVVGDVHGDLNNFQSILQKTGLINPAHHWSGDNATLVQVGDLVDRGPKVREVLNFMMALEPEARKAGGRVVFILGNHEVMNIMGDLRYVTEQNFAGFADKRSEKRRRAAWRQYADWRSEHTQLLAELPSTFALTEEHWTSEHPLGFIEQREAYSRDGKYGKWLRGHDAVAKLDGMVFVHGGLDENVASLGVDGINKRVREEIDAFDSLKAFLVQRQLILPFFTLDQMIEVVKAQIAVESKTPVLPADRMEPKLAPFLRMGGWLILAQDGPFWFRGYDEWSDEQDLPKAEHVLQLFGAKLIAVGHSPQKDGRIRSRFGNKVFLIDTGLLGGYYPGGRPSALEIGADGEIAAQYLDERVILQPPSAFPAAAHGVAPH